MDLIVEISVRLHESFQHPCSPIKKTTMSGLDVSDLVDIYRFLTSEILIRPGETPTRPECPVKHPMKQSVATVKYKQPMLGYIAYFGLELNDINPCKFPAAILEALANYAEQGIEEGR